MKVWEVKQSKYIDFKKLNTVHFYTWKKGLRTGMYYLRTKPRANTKQFTVDPTKAESTVSHINISHTTTNCTATPRF